MLDSLQAALESAKVAQREWKRVPVSERARLAGRVAGQIERQALELCQLFELPYRQSDRETLSSELLPLAAAAQWLAKNAASVLQEKRLGQRGIPFWLGKLSVSLQNEPYGLVLILATWNYPWFLMGVQSLQAIVAGNAVCVKPAEGCIAIARRWRELLIEAGFPQELIVVLGSEVSEFDRAVESGVDLVLLTGGSSTGKKVLEKLAPHTVPAILELGGCDAMIVLSDQQSDRAIRSIRFSVSLNSSATCMASRRIFVQRSIYDSFRQRVAEQLSSIGKIVIQRHHREEVEWLKTDAIARGALPASLSPSGSETAVSASNPSSRQIEQANDRWQWIDPILLYDVPIDAPIMMCEVFAPLLLFVPYDSEEELVSLHNASPHGLSASIFGPTDQARQIASQLNAGFVTINDTIVPTADPRVPFGGRGASGWGVTRGLQGLLALTRPKVVSARKGNWLPHLDLPHPSDSSLLFGMLSLLHGETWGRKWKGLKSMVKAIRERSTQKRS